MRVCMFVCLYFTRLVTLHRVMVLSEGRIAEFDSPNQLIAKKGMFYRMAKDAGLV